jgi:DNA-binding CsgD family transcriptional regulator
MDNGEDTVAWYRSLGEIIDGLESERFLEHFIERFGRLVAFDLATIFVYRGRSRPLVVYDNFQLAGAQRGIAAYVQSSYVLNPFYQAYLKGIGPGVYRIRDLAPDAFFVSEYYKSYRALPRASEEIGFITDGWPEGMEEALIVFALENGEVGELGIYRDISGGGFSDGELARIAAVEPALGAIFRKYWASAGGAQASPPDSRVDDAFAGFGEEILSDRERQVMRMILHGHSSESICFNLGISLGTVKTHRKHAYAKLGISSQSELLSLFLQSLQAL